MMHRALAPVGCGEVKYPNGIVESMPLVSDPLGSALYTVRGCNHNLIDPGSIPGRGMQFWRIIKEYNHMIYWKLWRNW